MPEMTEEQFTTEASAFLTANASRKAEQKALWGEGPTMLLCSRSDCEQEQLTLPQRKNGEPKSLMRVSVGFQANGVWGWWFPSSL